MSEKANMKKRPYVNILVLVGFGVCLLILYHEFNEIVQSKRLAEKVAAVIEKSGVDFEVTRITPYDTTYSVDLAGNVVSFEDAVLLKQALIKGLRADEIEHLKVIVMLKDEDTSESRMLLWDDF